LFGNARKAILAAADPPMLLQRALLWTFLASLAGNLAFALADPRWLAVPAMLLAWYLADLLSGLIHMYMDYRALRAGMGLDAIYFYAGSRESPEYEALKRERMARLNPFEQIAYDFKNHHPRPEALGRRSLWRLIGSTVIAAALPRWPGCSPSSSAAALPSIFTEPCTARPIRGSSPRCGGRGC
jgi:hypothetical protein